MLYNNFQTKWPKTFRLKAYDFGLAFFGLISSIETDRTAALIITLLRKFGILSLIFGDVLSLVQQKWNVDEKTAARRV